MPTFQVTQQFRRDMASLSARQKQRFRESVAHFVSDLRRGVFRKGLRVKRVEGTDGVYEMTWSMLGENGRATFQYGAPVREGEPHVIWRRLRVASDSGPALTMGACAAESALASPSVDSPSTTPPRA